MEDIWNTLMRNPEYDNIVKQMMDENYMQVAIGTNPIVDINDESTNSDKNDSQQRSENQGVRQDRDLF